MSNLTKKTALFIGISVILLWVNKAYSSTPNNKEKLVEATSQVITPTKTFSLKSTEDCSFDFSTSDYVMNFEESDTTSLKKWKYNDVNNDNKTWGIAADKGVNGTQCAYYDYSTSNAANDWLFSRCFDFRSSKRYIINFQYKVGLSSYPEKFKIAIKTSDLLVPTEIIKDFGEISNSDYVEYTDTISVDSDGAYNICFGCYSDMDKYYLFVDNFSIKEIEGANDGGNTGGDDGGNTSGLVANFTSNVIAGDAPLTVNFTDSSTGSISSREWNFGDCNNSSDSNPSHTYNSPGIYVASLTISDGTNETTKEILIYVYGDGKNKWTKLDNGFNIHSSENDINGIDFSDACTGIAVGGSSTIKIMKTTDGGTSWKSISTNVNSNTEMFDVAFKPNDNLLVVGKYGRMMKSSDIGETWTNISNSISENLYSVKFHNNNIGWTCGGNGTLYKTTDGGDNWTSASNGLASGNNYKEIQVFSKDTVWLVGTTSNGAALFKTFDGGQNWSVKQVSGVSTVSAFHFLNENTGWICGSAGLIYKTTDGGENWTIQTSGTTRHLRDIKFISENQGWAIGQKELILTTTDGGTTWSTQNGGLANDFEYLYDICIATPGVAYVAGNYALFKKYELTPESLIADFEVSATNGEAPFEVTFTDKSIGEYSIWQWDFDNDGTVDAFTKNPTYTYTNKGTFSVKLTISDGTETKTIIKNNLITVTKDDGGSTGGDQANQWKWVQPQPQGNHLNMIRMVNTTTGYCAGAHGTILKTTDSWQNYDVLFTGHQDWLNCVYFIDESTGFAGGSKSFIYKTTDGGSTWIKIKCATSPGSAIYDIGFTNATSGFAVTHDGYVYKTTDAGSTWNKITHGGSTKYKNGINFINSTTGFIVGGLSTSVIDILKTTDGGSTWSPTTTPVNYAINSIYFVNSTTGYAVGYKGTILKTTDGGDNWALYSNSGSAYSSYTSSAINAELKSVYFTDENNGYAAGSYYIYKTTDGGTSWTQSYKNTKLSIKSLSFTSSSNGIAVGENGAVLKTTDGGTTWTPQYESLYKSVYGIEFFNSSTGVVVYNGDYIRKTTNGGESWSNVSSSKYYLYDLLKVDNTTLIAVGSSGKILKSTDSGDSWIQKSSGTSKTLYSVCLANQNTIYAAGYNGTVLKSTDKGDTWSATTVPEDTKFNDVYFFDGNNGIVVGGGFATSKVYKTNDGGSTWTEITTGLSTELNKIYFTNINKGFILGDSKTLLSSTDKGDTWSAVAHETSTLSSSYCNYESLDFYDASNGMIVGTNGMSLITTDGGNTWNHDSTCVANSLLNAVEYTGESSAFVGGSGSAILKYGNTSKVDAEVTAQFSATPVSGNSPLSVQFTDESTGIPNRWEWNFGDYRTCTEQNPTHIFGHQGEYTVTLKAANDTYNDTEIKELLISVTDTCRAHRVNNFTTSNGLVSTGVSSVYRAKNGDIWITTHSGIGKYDGTNWTNTTNADGITFSQMKDIIEDKNGNIWASSSYGIYKYDGNNWSTEDTDGAESCVMDKNGNLWFASSLGVFVYDYVSWTKYKYQDNTRFNNVNDVAEDANGNMWFGKNGGLMKFDGTTWTEYTTADGLGHDNVHAIMVDRQGNIWAASGSFGSGSVYPGALTKFDGTTWTTYDMEDGLGANYCNSLYQDALNNIWVGTYTGGVSKFDGSGWITFNKENDGLVHNVVNSITEDNNGEYWLATNSGITVLHDCPNTFPDLSIRYPRVGYDIVTPGETFNIIFNIDNNGSTDCEASKVKVYISSDNSLDVSNDMLLYTHDLDALAKSESINVNKTLKMPTHLNPTDNQTEWFLFVVTDSNEDITEINENNNVSEAISVFLRSNKITPKFDTYQRSGSAPLTVSFTNETTGNYESCSWDFNNDGTIDATDTNPEYIYTEPGTYTVKLIVSDGANNFEEVKTDYITVNSPVNVDFSANITEGYAPLTVQFTDLSSPSGNSCEWDFDNDGTTDATSPNPEFTYTEPGTYTVVLKVNSGNDTQTETKIDFITVNIKTAIHNNKQNEGVFIYPNPTSDFITIKSDLKDQGVVKIVVVNSEGVEVLRKNCEIGKPIDIQNLNQGVYFISILSDENKITKKLMVK